MSTLGYRELKKEQEEIILRFIFSNDVFLVCYQQVLVKVSVTLVYLGSLTTMTCYWKTPECTALKSHIPTNDTI